MTIPIRFNNTGRFVYLQLSTRPVKPGVMCFAYGSLVGGWHTETLAASKSEGPPTESPVRQIVVIL